MRIICQSSNFVVLMDLEDFLTYFLEFFEIFLALKIINVRMVHILEPIKTHECKLICFGSDLDHKLGVDF